MQSNLLHAQQPHIHLVFCIIDKVVFLNASCLACFCKQFMKCIIAHAHNLLNLCSFALGKTQPEEAESRLLRAATASCVQNDLLFFCSAWR